MNGIWKARAKVRYWVLGGVWRLDLVVAAVENARNVKASFISVPLVCVCYPIGLIQLHQVAGLVVLVAYV